MAARCGSRPGFPAPKIEPPGEWSWECMSGFFTRVHPQLDVEFGQLRVAFSAYLAEKNGADAQMPALCVFVVFSPNSESRKMELLSRLDEKLNLLPLHKTLFYLLWPRIGSIFLLHVLVARLCVYQYVVGC